LKAGLDIFNSVAVVGKSHQNLLLHENLPIGGFDLKESFVNDHSFLY